MGFLDGLVQAAKTKAAGATQKAKTAAATATKKAAGATKLALNPKAAIAAAQQAATQTADKAIMVKAIEEAQGRTLTSQEKDTVGMFGKVVGGPSSLLGGYAGLLSVLIKIGIGLLVVMSAVAIYSRAGGTSALEALSFMGGSTTSALISGIVFSILTVLAFIGTYFIGTTGSVLDVTKHSTVTSLVIICAMSAAISFIWMDISGRVDQRTKTAAAAEQTAAALSAAATTAATATATTKTEGFADGSAAPAASATTLLGSQLMTIKQAGYLGPPDGGLFKPAEAVTNALRAGFRSFVLRIDSLIGNKDPAKFAAAGEPTLLYTTDSGALLSANSGSIEEVAKTIYDHAFTPMMPNSEQPIFLYLHVARAPTATKEADKYKRFLSKIAKQLGPLAPYHLGMTPLGVFHRQKNQDALLAAPLTALKGQVIIATNANTDMFRTASAAAKPGEKPGAPAVNPAEDLDYWVNLRVYLEGEEPLGITLPAESDRQARAVVASAASLLELKGPKADAFAQKGKQRFVIALAPAARNPTPAELDHLLNTLGVNMVGLDMFSDDLGTVKELLKTGYDHKSYRPKPAALQHSPPLK